jgi:hypothetical protein
MHLSKGRGLVLAVVVALLATVAMSASSASAAPARTGKAASVAPILVELFEANGTTRTGAGATIDCQNAATGQTSTTTSDQSGEGFCWVPYNTCWWIWATFPQNYEWGSFGGNWAVYQCVGTQSATVYLRLNHW